MALRKFKRHISDGHIDKAILLLEQHLSEFPASSSEEGVILLKGRISAINQSKISGIIKLEDILRHEAEILQSLLSLGKEILNYKDLDSKPKHINPNQVYNCNRKEQVYVFENKLVDSVTSRINVFIIQGEESESPVGLYKRFCGREVKFYFKEIEYIPEPFSFTHQNDFNYLKRLFLRDLYQSIKIDVNSTSSIDDVRGLYDSPFFKGKKCVVLGVKIYSHNWNDTTIKLLNWFANEYCKVEIPISSPKIIIIFQINYTPEKSTYLGRFLKKTTKVDRIRAKLSQLTNIFSLPNLESVSKSDINIWLDIITQNAEEKRVLINKYFTGKTSFPMSLIESKLKEVIVDSNNSKSLFKI